MSTLLAQRDISNPVLSPKLRDLTGPEFFSELVPNVITLGFIIATIIALGVLLMGGIKWMTSGGDREATAGAQKTLTAGVVGLIIVFSLYAVLSLIGYFFNLDLLTLDLTPIILK
jgi:hypothetical protein